ncbi:MAG: FhaA domain-containing protein [Anaerolineales bacterium]
MNDPARLEKDLKTWVEDVLMPVLREGSLSPEPMASKLAREIDELARRDAGGSAYVPDQFTFSFHPDALVGLGGTLTDVHASLSKSLEDKIIDLGFRTARRLHVSLATDPTLGVGEVQVIGWHSGDPLKVTRELSPTSLTDTGTPPEEAFLMLQGRRHFPLTADEIRIGRLLENDLVIDTPTISRRHALIRLEHGRYVLYDLKSTAGTTVNGKLVAKVTLRPGDLITVADVEIVYGEGAGGPPTESPAYSPPEGSSDAADVTPLDVRPFEYPTKSFRKDVTEPDPPDTPPEEGDTDS